MRYPEAINPLLLMNDLITSLSTCFSLHFSASEWFNPHFPPAETLMFCVPAMSFYKSVPSAEAIACNFCSETWGRNLAQAVILGSVMSVQTPFCRGFSASVSAAAALQGIQ